MIDKFQFQAIDTGPSSVIYSLILCNPHVNGVKIQDAFKSAIQKGIN